MRGETHGQMVNNYWSFMMSFASTFAEHKCELREEPKDWRSSMFADFFPMFEEEDATTNITGEATEFVYAEDIVADLLPFFYENTMTLFSVNLQLTISAYKEVAQFPKGQIE